MGCCCPTYLIDEHQHHIHHNNISFNESEINRYQNQIDQNRRKGNYHFKKKQYQQAIKLYKLAINSNPNIKANYTNMALCYKLLGLYRQSITIIQKMLKLHYHPENDLKFIVKGKIIKSRCQYLLAKNYCVHNGKYQQAESQQEAKELVEKSIKCLNNLLLSKIQRNLGSSMQASKFLENAKMILKYLSSKKFTIEDENLLKYLNSRLKSQDCQTENFQKVVTFFQQPLDLINFIQQRIKSERAQQIFTFAQQQNQEFLVDPITYQEFTTPIIVKSGITYEEEVLKEHMKKNGTTDPITRQELNHNIGQFGVKNNAIVRYLKQCEVRKNVKKEDLMFMDD